MEEAVTKNKYRYERKYVVVNHDATKVESIIKFHPAIFKEIYQERFINNIYFDTLGFKNYNDNVDGCSDRMKVRIRWYGNLFGKIIKPTLEFKIKKGLVGYKESFLLDSYEMKKSFSINDIHSILAKSKIPEWAKNKFHALHPTLLNRYSRKYYLSSDKNYRVTIDKRLEYYKISSFNNNFSSYSQDLHSTTIELKYDANSDSNANNISAKFPFRLSKNSKYVNGIDLIYNGSSKNIEGTKL